MSNQFPTWLDQQLSKLVQAAGSLLPTRPAINVLAPLTATDNPANNSTDIALRAGIGGGQTNLTLVNGLNSNVNTAGQSVVRVGGPSAAYSIDGFVAGTAGARFVIINTTSHPLTIVNEGSGSTAANRTQTLRSVPITLPTAGSSAAFVYDGTASRWVLEHIGTRMPFEFNVRDFGATGDGTTDDSAAIQAAIAAAGAVGGEIGRA